MNIYDFVTQGNQTSPFKVAVHFQNRVISYVELERLINRIASGLISLGLQPGDICSLVLHGCPELIATYLGAVKAGLTVNIIPPRRREMEILYYLKKCRPRVMVLDVKHQDILPKVIDELPFIEWRFLVGSESTESTWDDLLERGEDDFDQESSVENGICHLLFTSGSSDRPKGILSPHSLVSHNATLFGQMHFRREDTVMITAPIYHPWGLVNGVLGILSRGGTALVVDPFDPKLVLADIETRNPTVLFGIPTHFRCLLNEPETKQRDLSSIRLSLSTAAKLQREEVLEIRNRFKWGYTEVWGLVEAGWAGASSLCSELREGSCGRLLNEWAARVVDEKNNPLPPGHLGQLCLKGDFLSTYYLNDPRHPVKAVDEDGWFLTGDMASIDRDGFLFVKDRIRDMIHVGGQMVSPCEVEAQLLAHPQIEDCVVIAVPHTRKRQTPKAYVQLKPGATLTEEELLDFCRQKMPIFQVPGFLEFVRKAPRSECGQPLRRLLKEREKRIRASSPA